MLVPAPSLVLLPLTLAAPELSPWLVLFNVFCCAIGLRFYRRALPVFVVGGFITAWPLFIVHSVTEAMSRQFLNRPPFVLHPFLLAGEMQIQAKILPRNIHYYPANGAGLRPAVVDIYAFDAVFSGVGNQIAIFYVERFLRDVFYGSSHELAP